MDEMESQLGVALDDLRRSLNDAQVAKLQRVLELSNELAQRALRDQLQASSQVYKLLDGFTND